MSLEAKKTIFNMSAGIIIYEILLALAFVPISRHMGYSVLSVECGVIVGTVLLYISLIHMAIVTSDVLASKDANYANKKTVIHAMIRKIVLIVILVIIYFIDSINILAVIFAMLGMKPGAYLAPFSIKFFDKIKK